jgi:hypothetical protein
VKVYIQGWRRGADVGVLLNICVKILAKDSNGTVSLCLVRLSFPGNVERIVL